MEGNESKRARRQLSHQLSLLQSTSLAIHSHTLPLSHARASRNAHSSRKPMYTPSPEGFSSDPETADVVPSPQFGQSIAPPVPGTPGHRAHLGREKAEVQDRRKKKKKKGAPVWKGAIGKQRTVVTSPASTGFRVPCFSGSQSPLLYNKKVGLYSVMNYM